MGYKRSVAERQERRSSSSPLSNRNNSLQFARLHLPEYQQAPALLAGACPSTATNNNLATIPQSFPLSLSPSSSFSLHLLRLRSNVHLVYCMSSHQPPVRLASLLTFVSSSIASLAMPAQAPPAYRRCNTAANSGCTGSPRELLRHNKTGIRRPRSGTLSPPRSERRL